MKFPILLLVLILAVSCAPQPQATQASPEPDTPVTSPPEASMPTEEPITNPFSPQPGDVALTRSNVYLNESSLVIRESFPPQISLMLRGDLPTPCNQLRVAVSAPDQDNKILVDVYSLMDPNLLCTQVLEPFEESIDLGTFPAGHYTVRVNGELAGEFDS